MRKQRLHQQCFRLLTPEIEIAQHRMCSDGNCEFQTSFSAKVNNQEASLSSLPLLLFRGALIDKYVFSQMEPNQRAIHGQRGPEQIHELIADVAA